MPAADGFEATRVLRAKGVEIPIIAATASASAGDFDEALQAGMNDIIEALLGLRLKMSWHMHRQITKPLPKNVMFAH